MQMMQATISACEKGRAPHVESSPVCDMAPDGGGANGEHGVKTNELHAHGCAAKEELAQRGKVSVLGWKLDLMFQYF
jgi:hypothetical protein